MTSGVLTIGELAGRVGIAASALRYYEELGLLPAPARVSGQRRYPESAVELVATLLLLRDVGFSLSEQKKIMATRAEAPGDWRRFAQRKLAELDDQIANAQAARDVIEHGLRCRHASVWECPRARRLIAGRLAGQSIREAHSE